MKWFSAEYMISKAYDQQLRNKLVAFESETGTCKALHLTMVTPHGVKHNAYWGELQAEVVGDDLFL